MTSRPDRPAPGGTAYLDLRRLDSNTNRPADKLHQLCALEGFLDQLTRASHGDQFALQAGIPLPVYSERRPTRDIDFAASQIQSDLDSIRKIINEILGIEVDDCLEFDVAETGVGAIRDHDAYPGVQVRVS